MFYYELLRPILTDSNRTFLAPSIYSSTKFVICPNIKLAYAAERIWKESFSEVVYWCNRTELRDPENITVDLKEFAWIKLQAKAL